IGDGISQGKTPEQIVQDIRARREQDSRYLGIDYKRQDAIMLQALAEQAQRNGGRDVIEGILNQPRVVRRADGTEQDIGSLA
ncbi:hypothetical protein, partial [Klebsiella aerogenes]|uniref:hypothetical protein n=1 Tax=Klebsiella aerogenes TaxID=548 RepID=UPI0013D0033A